MRNETREWDKPFINWSSKLSNEFVKWLIETYGDKGAHQYLNEFRAVKDVMASVEVTYEQYRFGWTDMRGVFGK